MIAVKEVFLEKESAFGPYLDPATKNGLSKLKPLSRINLFVGANNSGKSRFMREFAKVEKLRFLPGIDFVNLKAVHESFLQELSGIYAQHGVVEMRGAFPTLAKIQPLDCVTEGADFLQPVSDAVARMIEAKPDQVNFWYGSKFNYDPSSVHHKGQVAANKIYHRLQELLKDVPVRYEFDRIYLPVLRGLRRLPGHLNPYDERTKSDYFSGANHVKIFTGLTLYEDTKALLLGTLEDRDIVNDFQSFLSNAFFDRQPVALIPRHNSELHVKIGHEKEYPIHDLGDGIQAIIALTFPLFRARGKAVLVFIEEPEIYLHPGLQRLFLNVILETPGFEGFQYFIATHSNHFLDLTLDLEHIAVFTFRKELEESDKKEREARFLVENVSNENEQTLQLLGVRNSSVFFSNCTIWVEGVTDRRYFAKYLALYEESLTEEAARKEKKPPPRFKQDLHYSFVEYSGGNITHWSVLDNEPDPMVVERLCAKLFLITDRDDLKNRAKAERHAALEKKLGKRYYCLPCREVENLLTPAVIARVVGEYEGAEVPVSELTQTDYLGEPLGKFIEDELLNGKKKRKGRYAEDSGTITDKTTFCQRALGHLKSFSDLSPHAQEVTRRLHEFIREQNR